MVLELPELEVLSVDVLAGAALPAGAFADSEPAVAAAGTELEVERESVR